MSEDSVTVMLSPGDDTETILEKVRTTGAQKISLIVPPGNKALQTLGGFTMLRKACDITGIDLTVYSDDEKTCDMAKVCRFEVVHLDSEAAPRAAPPEEQVPRIVVSTRPPEPEVGPVAPAAEEPARSAEVEARLEGLSEEDLALFDALESMSLDEDVELGPAMGRSAEIPTFELPEEEEEEFVGAPLREVRPAREPRAEREPRARKKSPLSSVLDPLVSALGNIYIAVLNVVISIASRFQGRQAAEPAAAAVGSRERTEEDVRSLQSQKRRYYGWSLLAVIAFTLILLGLYFFSLPKAVVTLLPKEQEAREIDVTLQVLMTDEPSKEGTSTEGTGVTIEAKTVQVELQGQSTIPTSGESWIPEGSAAGAVILTNLTEYDIYVPAGTRLTGGGASFHTIEDISVPASYFWGSGSYVGKAQVGIICDTPGSAGNVDVWAITTIEGDLAGLLRVVNEEPTSGGAERQGHIVTAEDQEQLRQQLVVDLQQQSYQQLQAEVGGLEVLSGTLKIETVEETFSQEIGKEADSLTLQAKVRASALASPPGALDQAIEAAVQQKLGQMKAGQEVSGFTHGAIQAISAPSGGVGTWAYQTKARVSIANRIDKALQDEIRQALQGKTMAEVKQIMQSYQDRLSDFFISPVMDRLPSWGLRIRVVDISQVRP
ncbi:MAG: baseplate J/gp47 family protein [Chloroflexia bacterium]|nr:baseplate J/gp47 family protein [Chloroflexia bacterium]